MTRGTSQSVEIRRSAEKSHVCWKPSLGWPARSYKNEGGPFVSCLSENLSDDGNRREGIGEEIWPGYWQCVHCPGCRVWNWGHRQWQTMTEASGKEVDVRCEPGWPNRLEHWVHKSPFRLQDHEWSTEEVGQNVQPARNILGWQLDGLAGAPRKQLLHSLRERLRTGSPLLVDVTCYGRVVRVEEDCPACQRVVKLFECLENGLQFQKVDVTGHHVFRPVAWGCEGAHMCSPAHHWGVQVQVLLGWGGGGGGGGGRRKRDRNPLREPFDLAPLAGGLLKPLAQWDVEIPGVVGLRPAVPEEALKLALVQTAQRHQRRKWFHLTQKWC